MIQALKPSFRIDGWQCMRLSLFKATGFAYVCVVVETCLFALSTILINQPSSYLRTQDEYLLVGLSLCGVFWIVSFTTSLLPLLSFIVALYLAYCYWAAGTLSAEHTTIVSWYFFSVLMSFVFKRLYEIVPGFKKHSKISLLETHKAGLAFIVWLAMFLGLTSGVFWRVPLVIGARKVENMSMHKNDRVSSELPIVWWLYAGDGRRSLRLLDTAIETEVEAREVSKDRIVTLLFWVDKADRQGYCTSEQWWKLSEGIALRMPLWMGNCSSIDERNYLNGICKYLIDGYRRHGFYSDSERIDRLRKRQ